MWKLLSIFTVISNFLILTNGAPRDSDLDEILRAGDRKRENDYDDSADISDSDKDARVLRTADVLDLIRDYQIKHGVNLNQGAVQAQTIRWPRPILGPRPRNPKFRPVKKYNEYMNIKDSSVQRPLQTPKSYNRIDFDKNVYNEESRAPEPTGLNRYSKILLVLDPAAVEQSKNKNEIKNLISAILSLASKPKTQSYLLQTKQSDTRPRPRQYGFLARRYKRDSNEGYGSGGAGASAEEYAPKRQEHKKGSGSGMGRTGIPYMNKHRGQDIYEKE